MTLSRREIVANALRESARRLDAVLSPWDFTFEFDEVQWSHTGPYATGHYSRSETRILVSCRNTIDNLYYKHSFTTQHAYCREIERCIMSHDTLMDALGHREDSYLVVQNEIPDIIAARDGGDRVQALILDWTCYAADVLREPNERFYEIIRSAGRFRDIEY
jgi:hypothetical protein